MLMFYAVNNFLNAFKHGIKLHHPSFIKINGSLQGNAFTFRVVNSNFQQQKNDLDHPAGIGLENVKKRLDLIYPNQYQLTIHDIAEILYIEKDDNYVFFHTLNSRLISRLNMQQLMDLLPENQFLRVHKSFVIALRHIDVFEHHQVTIGNKIIPVSKTQRESLIQAIQHF